MSIFSPGFRFRDLIAESKLQKNRANQRVYISPKDQKNTTDVTYKLFDWNRYFIVFVSTRQ